MHEVACANALKAAFAALDVLPQVDGRLHRFHVPGDRPGSRNGWYVFFADGIPSGAFGSWKTGQSQSWCSREPASPYEATELARRISQARQQRDTEQRQRQQQAAEQAQRLWQRSRPADPEHPYLTRKGCQPHGLHQLGDTLLVPLIHAGQIVNLQRIATDGGKYFLPGGQVKGCYALLGQLSASQSLYLCEGWATGATLHQVSGVPVACAMNAGNLLPAGLQLRQQYPDTPLIVAGDDDRQTAGNPGRTAANHAAAMLGCGLILPPWCGAEPQSLTDFNDLYLWQKEQQQ